MYRTRGISRSPGRRPPGHGRDDRSHFRRRPPAAGRFEWIPGRQPRGGGPDDPWDFGRRPPAARRFEWSPGRQPRGGGPDDPWDFGRRPPTAGRQPPAASNGAVAAVRPGVAEMTADIPAGDRPPPAASRRPAPLRIALQIERFLPGKGGAEGYARSLAAGLAAAGHEVTVIAGEGSDPPPGVRLDL